MGQIDSEKGSSTSHQIILQLPWHDLQSDFTRSSQVRQYVFGLAADDTSLLMAREELQEGFSFEMD
jgi:hypothetical protein